MSEADNVCPPPPGRSNAAAEEEGASATERDGLMRAAIKRHGQITKDCLMGKKRTHATLIQPSFNPHSTLIQPSWARKRTLYQHTIPCDCLI